MAESIQHKISRVRPPRVQITYDVEIGDAIQKKELPFVIGVIADLSKQRGIDEADEAVIEAKAAELLRERMKDVRRDKMTDEEWAKAEGAAKAEIVAGLKRRAGKLDPLDKRDFVEIDRDNFNQVLAESAPRVKFTVPNVMQTAAEGEAPAGDLAIDLTFSDFEEFGPMKLVEKVPELKDLLKARNNLRDFLLKLDGNAKLNSTLTAAMADEAELKKVLEDIKAKRPAAEPAAAEGKK